MATKGPSTQGKTSALVLGLQLVLISSAVTRQKQKIPMQVLSSGGCYLPMRFIHLKLYKIGTREFATHETLIVKSQRDTAVATQT